VEDHARWCGLGIGVGHLLKRKLKSVLKSAGATHHFMYNSSTYIYLISLNSINMLNFALAVPLEVCLTFGERARARRLMLNLSVEELAARVGISNKTLSNFERTGRCTFETFVRVLEALDALPDLQNVLITHALSIDDMRLRAAVRTRQRAYTKTRKVAK